MKKIILPFLILFLLFGCSGLQMKARKKIGKTLNAAFFENQFTGFLVVDPISRDTLYDYNSDKYFTPASNTKIFTLYTALKMLPDYVPTLKYLSQNDTLFIEGTGDPSVLHPLFNDSTALKFLEPYKNIALNLNNFQEERFAPGWAWEDYEWYFSPERSALPLYGNIVTVSNADSLVVYPSFFKDSLTQIAYLHQREEFKNHFYFDPVRKDTTEIPYLVDSALTRKLLENALSKKISLVNKLPLGDKKTLSGMSRDSIAKRMMLVSDNFIAEQFLVMAASTLSDTLDTKKIRERVLDSLLPDLKQRPRWVDGSGLSRYNLFTPESYVQILHHLYNEVEHERLFTLFPLWQASGTVQEVEKDGVYFIRAKSGSMGGVNNLSGYVFTKSGKVLFFSFMNNNFTASAKAVKEKMYDILRTIHEHY